LKKKKRKKIEEGIPRAFREPDFLELQKKWYDRLARNGFEDIEWTEPQGQNSHYLKGHIMSARKVYNHATEEHFRRVRIHLVNAKFDSPLERYIWKRYSLGDSYRTIIKRVEKTKKFNRRYSVFFIHGKIHKIIAQMYDKRYWEEDEVKWEGISAADLIDSSDD